MKKKKWLSALLAVAMVVSMAPAAVFAAGEGETVEIDTVDELSDAIRDQKANQKWIIHDGEYVLEADDLAKYADWSDPGQGNWYFPIHEDGIEIVGEGNVTITSNVESKNGVWASQDFVSVWSDGVTIDNIDILSKKEQNKAIEIMGKDFTLKNSTMLKVDENGSGSIIFNSLDNGDIGTATIENVTLYSWISTNYSKTGTLNTTDVIIDFTENFYAGYKHETSGYGWCPGIFNNNSQVTVNNTGLEILVDGDINLTEQIFNNGKLQENTKVVLKEDVSVDSMIDITTDNVILDLGGNTLTASDKFTNSWTNNNDAHLVQVNGASNVTIQNGNIVTTEKNKHAVNIYESENVVLNSLNVDNTNTLGGAPVVINNSSVTVEGNLDLTVGANSWYGINVDPKAGAASLTFADGSAVSMTGNDKLVVIRQDGDKDNIEITGAADAGLDVDADGDFVSHTHVYGEQWKNDADGHWKECICGEKSEYAAHTFKWVIDKEATATEAGSKHQECSVCGYKLDAVSIPATGGAASEVESEDTSVPSTGDSRNFMGFVVLLLVSGAGLATIVFNKSKKVRD